MGSDERKPSLWRGVVAGAAGGLLGSVVLKAFIVGMRRAQDGGGGSELDQGGPAHQVAEAAGQAVTGKPLNRNQRRIAGEVVHYGFGALVGSFYGGLGEYWKWVRWGKGTLFGTGVFAGADELSMPALGLVPKPTEETAGAQAQHWLAHLSFGVSAELVRAAVRRVL